ncbi:MAG TPA: GNAT family N-acetyltransferase [Dermatophilaceae bacterium]|nr:GNAT family N-acetyltransferase [Dermatophilaceae bacterium]
MQIRPIDLGSDDELRRFYDVAVAVRAFERPHFVPSTFADVAAAMRHDDPGERQLHWGLWEGAELVGLVTAWLPLDDNVETMWGEVSVHPDQRRRGYGARGLVHLVEQAKTLGRSRIVGAAHYPPTRSIDHPYRLFLENNGFRLGNVQLSRLLELPVSDTLLDELAAEAAAAYRDNYRVDTFEEVPEPLLPSLCAVMNRVATDAPTGEIEWEPESLTPTRYLWTVVKEAERGRRRLTSVAIDRDTGEVAAYTELILAPDITRAHQSGTLVDARHRGRRLGLAVKVANLQAVQERHADRVDIVTSNAAENPWMVAINDRLGFQPVEIEGEFYRQL